MIIHEGIHHISLIVTDLERAKQFYANIIGLREIERPAFDFPGAWYTVGMHGQQLHLLVHDGETRRTGGIDTRDGHFALRIADFDGTLAWLDRCGAVYRQNRNSIAGVAQIFLLDPDHNVIELNAVRS